MSVLLIDDSEILIVQGEPDTQVVDLLGREVVTIEGEVAREVIEAERENFVLLEGEVTDLLELTEEDGFIVAEGQSGPRGYRGEPGLAGSAGLEFPFAWGDASPRTVVLARAGKLVYDVQLTISQAFNGAAPALRVGDALLADRLLRADQNDPAGEGSYSACPAHVYAVDTDILLTITPGDGATEGAGLLTILIEQ